MQRASDRPRSAFLDAPFEDGGWNRALSLLARETRSARVQLVAFGEQNDVQFNLLTDEPQGWLDDWLAIGGGDPAINWRVACSTAPMVVVGEDSYAEARRMLRSDLYDDFAQAYDMVNGCQTVLHYDPGRFFGLATLRTEADGLTSQEDRRVFGDAAFEALTAIRLQRSLDHQGVRMLTVGLEAVRSAAFVCDGDGRVITMTAAAEQVLREPRGLRLSDGQLLAWTADDTAGLAGAVRAVLAAPHATSTQVWLRGGAAAEEGSLCEIFPLPRREWVFAYGDLVLVVVRQSRSISARDDALLRQVLHLTPAEATVGRMLAEGLSREEIARARGSTIGTVSAQINAIFRKSDVSREAELVAVVRGILG